MATDGAPARVRYRNLSSSFDWKGLRSETRATYQLAREADRRRPYRRRRNDADLQAAGAALTGLVDQPRTVEAEDGEGTLEEVRALVRSGRLTGQDLVDLGKGWQSIADTYEFDDLLHPESPFTGKTVAVGVVLVAVVLLLAVMTLG